MIRQPAHKNINNPPGQIVNKITKIDGTLQDYLDRKGYAEPKKKFTFEEWWRETGQWIGHRTNVEATKAAWNAGQENK
jgi:hypothetical protein